MKLMAGATPLVALLLPVAAAAQDVVEDTFLFPADGDERLGQAAPRLVAVGDGARGERNLFLDEADAIVATVVVRPNMLVTPDVRPGCEATLTLVLDGQAVGQIVVRPGHEEIAVELPLAPAVAGPAFSIGLTLADNVPGGCGSFEIPDGSSSWTFQDSVLPGENRRPLCQPRGPWECAEGGEVQLDTLATDPDGDPVVIGWDLDDDGDFDDADTADPMLSCEPFDGPAVHPLRVHVTDGDLDRVCASEVTVTNAVPALPDPFHPLLHATQQVQYAFCLGAEDPSPLDTVVYELVGAPQGMALDEDGCIEWLPTPQQVGRHDVCVRITDDDGGQAEPCWPITVMEDANAPAAFAGEDLDQAPCAAHLCCQGTDPRGLELTYEWTLGASPDPDLTLEHVAVDPTTRCIDPVLTLAGDYRFDCAVDNGELASAPDDVRVRIQNGLPTCDAGFGGRCLVGERCTLDGRRSSDPNGDRLTYRWVQQSPEDDRVAIPGVGNPIAAFTPLVPGIYCFSLECADPTGDGEPTEVCYLVDQRAKEEEERVPAVPADSLPIADCGRPIQRVIAGAQVQLDGQRSFDPEGVLLTAFEWSQVSGPETAIIGANQRLATVTPATEGVYVFSLRVQDTPTHEESYAKPRWSTACSTVVQAMAEDNLPPVADAGDGLIVRQGTGAELNGAGSSDPDGDELTWRWRQVRGPEVALTAVDEAVASFLGCTPGIYQFELIVNDGRVDSLPSTVWATVHTPCNQAPTADAGEAVVAYARGGGEDLPHNRIVLDGRQSFDPDALPGQTGLKYQWFQVGGLPTEVHLPFTRRPYIAPRQWDIYRLQLFALDSWVDQTQEAPRCWEPAWSLPAEVDVVAHGDENHIPIADAGPPGEWLVGDTVLLDGCGSFDTDGDPLSYTWRQTCGPPKVLENEGTCGPTYAADDTETRCFCLAVDDGWIRSLESCTAHRSIPNNNKPPVCRLPEDLYTRSGQGVVLDGAGSFDPDGDEMTFLWTQTCGDPVTLQVEENVASFRAPAVPDGADAMELCFYLSVEDGRADPAICGTTVHVRSPTAPERDAGHDPDARVDGLCAPGTSGDCRCASGAAGRALCRADGFGYQPCVCSEADAGGGPNGGTSTDDGCGSCSVGPSRRGDALWLIALALFGVWRRKR